MAAMTESESLKKEQSFQITHAWEPCRLATQFFLCHFTSFLFLPSLNPPGDQAADEEGVHLGVLP